MSDLTLVNMQMCASLNGPITVKVGEYIVTGLFHENIWPTCTCPAYKFGKRADFGGRMVPDLCKHIREAEKMACGWHQQYSPEAQIEAEKCPRCGGAVITVCVGV